MQNNSNSPSSPALPDQDDSLQAYFKPGVAPDDIEAVYRLKKSQGTIQAFTALFHGGFDGVLVRLLVLRELASDPNTPTYTRADINVKLAYMDPDSLETVLSRLRSHQLLVWDQGQGVYRVTATARNVLAALDSLLLLNQNDDEVEMGFLLSQVAGAQAVGGISAEQLQHLLGRLVELTEEFRDAIASGSEFRLRASQAKWHLACDWVEKGSHIIHSITTDPNADSATHRAAQAIGRAQSALLNMQGMFSRALNQIERQRVHLGQSGLSTTDIKTWLLQLDDIAALSDEALSHPVTPLFITPAEMVDVAEAELLSPPKPSIADLLPSGQDAPLAQEETSAMMLELDDWLDRLATFKPAEGETAAPVQHVLLPGSFAVASYRASMLPLLGDPNESALQGATAKLARLPVEFETHDEMTRLDDPHVAAITRAVLKKGVAPNTEKQETA
ncbi:MAG TPA: hypothetical protein VF472_16525 [Burkholderiaceae bacterium]